MFNKTILFLIFLFFSSTLGSKNFLKKLATEEVIESKVTQAFCYLNSNGTVYDLNPLYNSNQDYSIKTPTYEINFNVCKNANTKCGNKQALVFYNPIEPTGNCTALSGPATVVSKWSHINDTDKNVTSLTVTLPSGDVCASDSTKNYTTTMVFVCDEKAESAVIQPSAFDINQCSNTITINSRHACANINVYSFWNEIINNKYIIGSALIVLGGFLCLFGQKWILVVEVITGVLLTSFLVIFVLFANIQVHYNTMTFWLIIAASILAGLVVAFIIIKLKKWISALPVMILSGFLGYLMGVFLYNIALKHIQSSPMVIYWVTVISLIIVFVLLSYFLQKHISILATSFIGSYALIRGISIMVGHFPDERQIIDLIQRKEYEQVNNLFTWQVYVYLASIVILTIISMIIQYKYIVNDEKPKEEFRQDDAQENLIRKK